MDRLRARVLLAGSKCGAGAAPREVAAAVLCLRALYICSLFEAEEAPEGVAIVLLLPGSGAGILSLSDLSLFADDCAARGVGEGVDRARAAAIAALFAFERTGLGGALVIAFFFPDEEAGRSPKEAAAGVASCCCADFDF